MQHELDLEYLFIILNLSEQSLWPTWCPNNAHILLLLLLLLLKPAAQAQVGKPKLFINCFRNPTSTRATEKENTTQRSNQRLAAPLNPSSVPVLNTV